MEVDRETGVVDVLDYVTVHDAGRLLNPLLVDGQVRGGFAHGAGAALLERMHYDEDGNLLTGSFVDYLCLGAADVPPLRIGHLCTPSPFTPLGAKGLGEGNTMSVPAALAAAVADALGRRERRAAAHAGARLGASPVKPAAFEYRRAESLDDALELLAEAGDDAKPLAGGQSLAPLLNMRFVRPSLLVDLNGIAGLDGIERGQRLRPDRRARPAGRRSPARRSSARPARCSRSACRTSATSSPGIAAPSAARSRTRTAAPSCRSSLVALGGTVVTQSRAGRRELPADEFFVTHFTTALEPDELVTHTTWPAASSGWGYAFEELAQRHGDFALAMVACALRVEDGRVAEARLCLGAVTDRPTLVELPLAGRAVDAEAAAEAAEFARAAVEPLATMHASADYLRQLTGVLTERAVLRAWRNATGAADMNEITVTVNGRRRRELVEPRLLLSDFLRHTLGLTGTHVGCEHGVCGACTVRLDGVAVRSCLMFAVQVDGAELQTVEGLAGGGELTPLQAAFREAHALQCGFCTPGILMAAADLLDRGETPSRAEITELLSGHLCRCTGYEPIVDAIAAAAGGTA